MAAPYAAIYLLSVPREKPNFTSPRFLHFSKGITILPVAESKCLGFGKLH